jgi:hypothetical protein
MIYIFIYLTAIGLTPGGIRTVPFTHKQYTEHISFHLCHMPIHLILLILHHLASIQRIIKLYNTQSARFVLIHQLSIQMLLSTL